jgi:hypothetical protein
MTTLNSIIESLAPLEEVLSASNYEKVVSSVKGKYKAYKLARLSEVSCLKLTVDFASKIVSSIKVVQTVSKNES